MHLISIRRSNKKGKKFTAVFKEDNTGNIKKVHFGAAGYEDYTIHKDKDRRARYWARHKKDNLLDATSPGALSAIILWGPSTSIEKNIATFRNIYSV